MSTRKLRRPAALVASLALVFAVSACDDDTDPTDPVDPVTTTVPLETTTTPAG